MKQFLLRINHFFKERVDLGLLLFRLGLGGMFMWHGYPKIFGGMEKWIGLGKSMETLGIYFMPGFWGFMASTAEFVGGLCIVLGLFYRIACMLAFSNMLVATVTQLLDGKGLLKSSQALENSFSFIGALFVGPGKYSVDYYIGLKDDSAGH